MWGQLGIATLQILITLSTILAFHYWRKSFGLGPLYIALGGLELFVTFVTALWIKIDLPNELVFVTGSTSFFVVGFTALLLVYLCEGTLQARNLIFSLIGLQACHILWRLLVLAQLLASGGGGLGGAIPTALFSPDFRLNAASAVARIVTLFIFVIFYQWLSNRFSSWPMVVKIFASLLTSLVLDDLIFFTLGMIESPQFVSNLLGSVLSRPFSVILISPVLAFYLQLPQVSYRTTEDIRDPMDILQSNALLQASLAESEKRYENLFENANELILVVEPVTGCILDANRHTFEELSYSRDELLTRTVFDLYPAEDHPAIKKRLNPLPAHEHYADSMDAVVLCKDRSHRSVAIRVYDATLVGKPVLVFLMRDITERQQALEGLRQANRLKDEFLQNISHELRTPLCAIVGWSDLIASGVLTTEQQTTGNEQIRSSSEQLLQLINDLLDVAHMERGIMNLDIELAEINEPVQKAFEIFEFAAKNKGITFTLNLEPNLPLLQQDVVRIQQVVTNLLSNAIKFTPDGGQVTVSVQSIGREIEISVADTGVGISPSALPYIFEGFRQGDGSATRRFGGTGVGLALVKSLIELHGGSISVESEVKHGSTFRVRLPIPPQPVSGRRRITGNFPSLDERSSAPPDGAQVLIIDHDRALLDLAGAMVRSAGYKVVLATTLESAKAKLKDVWPTVVLIEVSSVMESESLLASLHSIWVLQSAKVIAMTTSTNLQDKETFLKQGFAEYLSKPFKKDQLVAVVRYFFTAEP
ncbi:MAG: PAS domain S-box protein [Acidobacteria bacterium]|nr:PAS domain S-box protein [Acidobacteriota bacterium]